MAFGRVTDDPYSLRDPYEEVLRPFSSDGGQSWDGGIDGSSGQSGFADARSNEHLSSGSERPFGNKQLIIALAVALALALVSVGYALSALRAPDIAAYADAEIIISGLADEDFALTPTELAKLKCSQLTAEGQGKGQQGESKAGTVTAYGPTLERFLEVYGFKPTDFDRIVVTCSDGYKVTLHGDMLEGAVLLSIAQGKGALDEFHQPLRLVMPAQESGKWCYGIERIDFEILADEGAEAEADGVIAVEEGAAPDADSDAGSAPSSSAGSDSSPSSSGSDDGSDAGSGSGKSFGEM